MGNTSFTAASARTVFELTLETLAGTELFERYDAVLVERIFDTPKQEKARTTLYLYPLLYLGRSVQLVAYRDEHTRLHDPAGLAYYNDTTGRYQPVSIDDAIAFLSQNTSRMTTNLDNTLVLIKEVHERVQTSPPSHPAPEIE